VHLVGHGGAAGVAGVFDDDELGAGPGAGELPRGVGAAAEVVAAVDQDAGDGGQLAGLADQDAVLEETVVREVVRADAHERQLRVVGPVAVGAGAPVGFLRDDGVFPCQPLGCGLGLDTDVGVLHHLGVRLEQARDRRRAVGRQPVGIGQAREVAEPGPGLGEEPADAPVQPVKLQPPGRGDAEHEHPADPLRMPLRVGQRQGHPPRRAAQQPLLHAEVLAQLLHVPEQVPGRVKAHVSRGVAGGRQAAAAVALVEDDDPELLRVERLPVSRRAPRPRAAVHDQRWHAIRVAAGLPVHEVPVTGVQQAGLVGLDIRVPGHAKNRRLAVCQKSQ
jgi:hypothetical protein